MSAFTPAAEHWFGLIGTTVCLALLAKWGAPRLWRVLDRKAGQVVAYHVDRALSTPLDPAWEDHVAEALYVALAQSEADEEAAQLRAELNCDEPSVRWLAGGAR